MGNPSCAKCGLEMTPDNARVHPEYFLHDNCLPDELKPKAKSPLVQKPLTGRWRWSNGTLCCGTMRIARLDFDTDPSHEFQEELLDWICNTLNEAK